MQDKEDALAAFGDFIRETEKVSSKYGNSVVLIQKGLIKKLLVQKIILPKIVSISQAPHKSGKLKVLNYNKVK